MKTEHRKYSRIQINELVRVRADGYRRIETAKNFSEGGILIETDSEFACGQMLTMTFQISSVILIPVIGQIVHIGKSTEGKTNIGVEFLGSGNYPKILVNYFKSRCSYKR